MEQSPAAVIQFSFNPRSLRVKKAKLAQRLRKRTLKLIQMLTLLLAGGGLFLLWNGTGAGYFVLALAVLSMMILAWNHWELSNLRQMPDANAVKSGRLEELLASDVAATFSWPASP